VAEKKTPAAGKSRKKSAPRVVILLGSSSDLPVIEKMLPLLDRFGLAYVVEVASAHRQPEKLKRIVTKTEKDGAEVYVAVAGMAAHLPGVVASMTGRPVIGVPVASGPLAGIDALLSIVQMPPGVPVATVAIGSAGASNAACLAARMLALKDSKVAAAVEDYRRELARGGR
jgi:phosphoribosylaminoimidazole carboxylase PurE protein